MDNKSKNVVLFPFMAQGHIIPYLALAKLIQQFGYTITFVNTPLNIKNLLTSHNPISSIKFVQIPFNSSDHGLPSNAENCDSLPPNFLIPFVLATSSLELPFKNLLANLIQEHEGEKPVCIISDVFFGWAADVVHEFGIFNVIFSPTGAFGMACYFSMWLNLPHKYTENVEFQLPDFPEAGTFHVTQLTAGVLAGGDNPITHFLQMNFLKWSNADALLFNTVEELDKAGLIYFRRKLGVPVWGVGPRLLSEEDRIRAGREATISAEKCLKWLDEKEQDSVIYISFGSQNTISASQMMHLANALDFSERNFIWVVRPPLGFSIDAEFVAEQWLPEGFIQRVQDQENRGLIVEKWAPQVEILGHKSVGAFVSHCGWNSVLESLKNGVPVIGWPLAAEQFYNAKFLVEEVRVCVEVARGTSFDVRQQDIVEKIELVMGGSEKGKEIRRKSLEVEEIVRDAVRNEGDYKGSSVKAMEDLFSAALLKEQMVETV